MTALNPPATLFTWQAERDAALKQVAENAGANFMCKALRFCADYIRDNGPISGELVTDACKAAGIVPPNTDKAFGAVYATLMRDKLIEREGYTQRRKGHGCIGASVWRAKV